ncbi:Pro-kumamolisin, activation domain-containing protein [Mycena metata]|uniref:Pro-kumamolisin, activation domain-containing protein n=1 Tax=Mycena metata TaxID=1033252 RepID=A0AAD7HQK3_9AGAR|nr:Pro-kumamolisin, activation domain-containing protein [Mycena metata]
MISKKWNYVSEKWNYVEKSTQTYSRIGNTYLSELSSKQVEKMVHAIAFNSREACRRFPPVGLDSAPPYGPQQRHPVAQNLHQLEDLLLSVSHPDSPTYGQHWSPAQIVDFFSPSHEPIAAVKNWLVDSGLSPERLRLSPSRGWINVDVTVAEAEDLLRTYTHPSSGVEQFGCHNYGPREKAVACRGSVGVSRCKTDTVSGTLSSCTQGVYSTTPWISCIKV